LNSIASADLHWSEDGYAAISGDLLEWLQKLDHRLLVWAKTLGAEEHRFPSFIAVECLEPIAYLKSFPHLATFASCGIRDESALRRMAAKAGELSHDWLDAPKQLLTPAACYHFYHRLAGAEINSPVFLTTKCQCHRRETHYLPLQRQWCFEMRELVCIGDAATIDSFAHNCADRVETLLEELCIDAAWQTATDPFFDPAADPKALAQLLEPSKLELCLSGGLAIASSNKHRSFFGECYDIRLHGKPAESACVAFGLERWMFAMFEAHGADVKLWPQPGSES
jgi:hypothetical protein